MHAQGNERFTKKEWEESEEEVEEIILKREDLFQDNIPVGEASTRLSIHNIDWDSVHLSDLYRIVSVFTEKKNILNLCLYKTALGKKMLEIEEKEGPLISIKECEDGVNSNIPTDKDIREYLRMKMKYYYAVISFATKEAAATVYEAINGLEIGETFNFIDSRFIPDEYEIKDSIEDEIKECEKMSRVIPKNPLYNTKAQLKWDEDPVRERSLRDLFICDEINLDLADELIDASDDSEKQAYYKKVFEEEKIKLLNSTENTNNKNSTENNLIDSNSISKTKTKIIANTNKRIKLTNTSNKNKKEIEEEIVGEDSSSVSEEEEDKIVLPVNDNRFTKEKSNPDFCIDKTHPVYIAKKKRKE